MAYSERQMWRSANLTLDGATDLEPAFASLQPVRIHHIGFMVTNTGAGGASVLFENRVGATTDTPIETVVIPAANVQGNVYWTKLDGTAAGPFLMEVGSRLNLAVTEAGTAPTAIAMVEYSIEDRRDGSLGATAIESA